MPSRSEGWGGLFKDEQYRLIRSASRPSIRSLRVFEQTTPPLRGCPSLLRRGLAQNRTYRYQHRSKRIPVVDFRFQLEFILDSCASSRRGVRDINKISRSVLCGADGVVSKFQQNLFVVDHHPVCAAEDATQLFLDRAATPPRRGGEWLIRHHNCEPQY